MRIFLLIMMNFISFSSCLSGQLQEPATKATVHELHGNWILSDFCKHAGYRDYPAQDFEFSINRLGAFEISSLTANTVYVYSASMDLGNSVYIYRRETIQNKTSIGKCFIKFVVTGTTLTCSLQNDSSPIKAQSQVSDQEFSFKV